MLPSTLELLRDIFREAQFLESEAHATNQVAFLGNEILKRAFVGYGIRGRCSAISVSRVMSGVAEAGVHPRPTFWRRA
jgi:hypothetical protein